LLKKDKTVDAIVNMGRTKITGSKAKPQNTPNSTVIGVDLQGQQEQEPQRSNNAQQAHKANAEDSSGFEIRCSTCMDAFTLELESLQCPMVGLCGHSMCRECLQRYGDALNREIDDYNKQITESLASAALTIENRHGAATASMKLKARRINIPCWNNCRTPSKKNKLLAFKLINLTPNHTLCSALAFAKGYTTIIPSQNNDYKSTFQCSLCLQDFASECRSATNDDELHPQAPMVGSCGHTFCASCLYLKHADLVQRRNSPTLKKFPCPACQAEAAFHSENMQLNQSLREFLVDWPLWQQKQQQQQQQQQAAEQKEENTNRLDEKDSAGSWVLTHRDQFKKKSSGAGPSRVAVKREEMEHMEDDDSDVEIIGEEDGPILDFAWLGRLKKALGTPDMVTSASATVATDPASDVVQRPAANMANEDTNINPPPFKRRKQSRTSGKKSEAGLSDPITIHYGSHTDIEIEVEELRFQRQREVVRIKCDNYGIFNLSAIAKHLQRLNNEYTLSIKSVVHTLQTRRRNHPSGCCLRFLFRAVGTGISLSFSTTFELDDVHALDAAVSLKQTLLNVFMRHCLRILTLEIEGANDVLEYMEDTDKSVYIATLWDSWATSKAVLSALVETGKPFSNLRTVKISGSSVDTPKEIVEKRKYLENVKCLQVRPVFGADGSKNCARLIHAFPNVEDVMIICSDRFFEKGDAFNKNCEPNHGARNTWVDFVAKMTHPCKTARKLRVQWDPFVLETSKIDSIETIRILRQYVPGLDHLVIGLTHKADKTDDASTEKHRCAYNRQCHEHANQLMNKILPATAITEVSLKNMWFAKNEAGEASDGDQEGPEAIISKLKQLHKIYWSATGPERDRAYLILSVGWDGFKGDEALLQKALKYLDPKRKDVMMGEHDEFDADAAEQALRKTHHIEDCYVYATNTGDRGMGTWQVDCQPTRKLSRIEAENRVDALFGGKFCLYPSNYDNFVKTPFSTEHFDEQTRLSEIKEYVLAILKQHRAVQFSCWKGHCENEDVGENIEGEEFFLFETVEGEKFLLTSIHKWSHYNPFQANV